mmetsp:Transcript_19301/g.54201  ORF Transcript_19301/g.54201 Transcript_19301/m.54201 type:complete len:254 (-) Transcript_19301:1429-2190(-)
MAAERHHPLQLRVGVGNVVILPELLHVPQLLQIDHLQHVEGQDVRVAHVELVLEHGVRPQQPVVAADGEDGCLGAMEARDQLLAESPEIVGGRQAVLVHLGDGGIRLGEDHLDHVQGDGEEGPLVMHLLQHVVPHFLAGLLDGLPDPQPHGQVQPRLRPGEHPRDGPQAVEAGVLLALAGPRADVEARQLADRGGGLEILDETRVLVHHLTELLDRLLAQGLHHCAPLRLGRGGGVQQVHQGGGGVVVQRAEA